MSSRQVRNQATHAPVALYRITVTTRQLQVAYMIRAALGARDNLVNGQFLRLEMSAAPVAAENVRVG